MSVFNIDEARSKVTQFEAEVQSASLTLTQFLVLTSRLFGLLRRMGLPENVAHAISNLMRLFLTIRMVRSALFALEMQTPYGWIRGLTGLATAGFMVADMGMEMDSR